MCSDGTAPDAATGVCADGSQPQPQTQPEPINPTEGTAPVTEQLMCSDGTAPDAATGVCADGSQPQSITVNTTTADVPATEQLMCSDVSHLMLLPVFVQMVLNLSPRLNQSQLILPKEQPL